MDCLLKKGVIVILEANTGLMSYSLTSCGEGVSLTSANWPSSDGIKTNIPYQLVV